MLNKPQIREFTIKERREVAEGTTEVLFDTGGEDFIFKPGQYIRITISELEKDVPKGNSRDFTIASSPDNKDTIAIAFRNSESVFKKTLLNLPIGTKVSVQGPLGVFTLPEETTNPMVFVAGGIGITPVLSMLRFVVANNIEQHIQIIYANSDEKHAAYAEEIRSAEKEKPYIKLIEKIGEVDVQFIKEHTEHNNRTLFYLCGVPEMTMKLAQDIPSVLGVPEKNIRIEEYPGYHKNISYRIFPPVTTYPIETTEEEIRSDRNLIKSLLDATGQGALIAVTDVQGTILYVNDKFLEIAKYDKDEIIGQNHRILKSGEHPPEFYKQLWETISAGSLWRGEIKNRSKDGTFYWVDTSITPIFKNDGTIDRYLAVRFLITDKKELEVSRKTAVDLLQAVSLEKEITKAEKEKLSTILHSIGDGVFVVDKDLNIVLTNKIATDLAGVKMDETIGKPYKDIFTFILEDTGATNEGFLLDALRTGEVQMMGSHTLIVNHTTKESTPVADSASPIRDSEGNISGVVVVFRDVSREREVDKEKTEFVSLASHQLKTPVGAMRWNIEMLLDGYYGDLSEEQKEVLRGMSTMNSRMGELIDGLLNISRIDLGVFHIEPEPVNFAALCDEVLEEMASRILKKQHAITKEYDNNLREIDADPKLLRIIFQNYISNAIKYTPDNGRIKISLLIKDGNIEFSVANNGAPIPQEDQDKIFNKLFRASNASEQDPDGNGLGLYTVLKIAENGGGKAWFTSREGEDTVFYATFPLTGMLKKEGEKSLS